MAGVRFLSWSSMLLALWMQTVAASTGNGNDPFLPPNDRATIQSFTFRMREDVHDSDQEKGQDESHLAPSIELNFWGAPPTPSSHQEKSTTHRSPFLADTSLTQQQTSARGDEYFTVVSSQSIWNPERPHQQAIRSQAEAEMDRESFMASWREFMFEQKEQQDDSDDDDDDNNDGSCSMLSNAAVNRSEKAKETQARMRVYAGGDSEESSHPKRSSRQKQKRRKRRTGTAFSLLADGPRSHSLDSIAKMRGGAAATPAQKLGSEVAKRLFVSALVTVAFEGCMGHVLEFIKIDMQTSSKETYTYSDSIKSITNEKGVAGLWDGFVPWGIIQSVFKGAVFGVAQTLALKILLPLAEAENSNFPIKMAKTLAGGIAGGFQGYVLSPTLLLKTRVMTDPVFRENMTMLQTVCKSATIGYNVVHSEGLGSLMKGANVFATKRVFDWATRYFFAEWFEGIFASSLREGETLSLLQKSTASFLGGVVSTMATLPLDVLVSKIQDAKKAGVKISALALFEQELKENGWSGLRRNYLRGFEARLLHVCLTVVVMKTLSPVAYKWLFG